MRGGLNVVNTDKAQLFWGQSAQLERDINIARRQRAGGGGEELILHVHFLIALRGALNLASLYGAAERGKRIVGLTLNA